MKTCCIVLGVVFATISGLASAADPVFPKCDFKLLKKIKTFWKGAGTPTNVLQLIADSEGLSVILTSRNIQQDGVECITMNSTNTSSLVFTFQCTNPCCQPIVLSYNVEESNGVISNYDGTIYRFTIFAGNGVIGSYFCNMKGGIQGPPVGAIYATNQNYYDNSTQTTIRATEGLMDLLGFQFVYEYSSNCV